MRGSILVKYNETPDSRGSSGFFLDVNNVVRNTVETDVNNYYSTFMFVGDVVGFGLQFPSGQFPNVTIYRQDYTTDDEGGDNGIKETLIPYTVTVSLPELLGIRFTGSTVSNAYNFKYVIDCSSGPLPTFYTWSLGYDASNATNACIDYATSPSTYYTTVPTLQNGIYLYDSNTIFDLSAAGYYSNGTNVWYKSDTTLTLTNESACVIPTPTPTPTPTLTPTPTVTPSFIGCFNPQPGFGPVTIWNLDIQTDDSILVAGTYNTYNSISYSAIIRLNADATIDNTFNIGIGFNDATFDVKTQSDGKILVGGNFTSYSGVSSNRIIRLNTNGSIDNSFNIGTGFDSPSLVFTIAIQSDGKILVGGIYASYNGTSSNYIIRLNTDGSIDTSFNIGTGFDGGVHTIKIQSDGKILIGGNFTSYNGVSRNRLIRLNQNGTVDVLFNIGSGFSDIVRDIEIQPDGKIILVGQFGNIPSPQYRRIVRLNSDGSIDTTFNAGTGIRGFNNTAFAVDLQSDGKIIVGGMFTTYNNTFSTNRVIRLNTDGSPDNTFNVGTGFNDTIHSLKVLSNNKIILGGQFTSYNGTLVDRIIRLNSNGTEDLCP
jgi:uncharacterized delta-60 repeat protein